MSPEPGLDNLLQAVRACDHCATHLPCGPRPVVQAGASARVLIAGQAPGSRVHETGIPFNDASGRRLRDWLGIDEVTFYDPERVAILPMGFCYPGKGRSGDLPPRPECAPLWRRQLLAQLPNIELTLVIGAHAQAWHLPDRAGSVTDTVRAWRQWWPQVIPLPHPSPRNNGWLKHHPWFEQELLPVLRRRVAELLTPRH